MPRIGYLSLDGRTLDLIGRSGELPDFPRVYYLPARLPSTLVCTCGRPISALVFCPDYPAFRCACDAIYAVRIREE